MTGFLPEKQRLSRIEQSGFCFSRLLLPTALIALQPSTVQIVSADHMTVQISLISDQSASRFSTRNPNILLEIDSVGPKMDLK